jgi:hypothetical protein
LSGDARQESVFGAEHVEVSRKQSALRDLIPNGITVRRGRGLAITDKVTFK